MTVTRTLPALLAMLSLSSACYSYVPVDTTPVAGERVQLEISDQGRVALTDRLGPGITRIEGRYAGAAEDQMLVDVSAVEALRGERTRWAGEQMRVPRAYVARVNTRELARGRTTLLAGGIAVGIVALAVSTDLAGQFVKHRDPEAPPPPSSLRWPVFRF